MRNGLLYILGLILISTSCFAQEDAHLKKLTNDLVELRKAKNSDEALNNAVISWSSSGCPKITLMDEIKRDEKREFRGTNANKFKMNQIVTHVYNRQNTQMVSKGDYFNSTEKDIYYSAIEKTIKKGCTVTYTLAGHVGVQEFVFLSFNPNTKFTAKVDGKLAKPASGKKGVLWITLPKVEKDKVIKFSISNNSNTNESFVILNHNPQK